MEDCRLKNEFLFDNEYNDFFFNFEGIRKDIIQSLIPYGLKKAQWVLDFPSGHGLLAHEVLLQNQTGKVVGIGLDNDLHTYIKTKNLTEYSGTLKRLEYCGNDITCSCFQKEKFDFIVNFLGLEDIHMTRGNVGLAQTFAELSQILKKGAILQIAINIEGNEPDEILNKEVTRYIGHNAYFHPKEFYLDLFSKNGIELEEEKWFYSRKKLTADQARVELEFACEETPKYFKQFGINCKSFNEVWEKFGERVKELGLAYYSDICILIGKKSE